MRDLCLRWQPVAGPQFADANQPRVMLNDALVQRLGHALSTSDVVSRDDTISSEYARRAKYAMILPRGRELPAPTRASAQRGGAKHAGYIVRSLYGLEVSGVGEERLLQLKRKSPRWSMSARITWRFLTW